MGKFNGYEYETTRPARGKRSAEARAETLRRREVRRFKARAAAGLAF